MAPTSTNLSAYDTEHASLRRQILRECEEMCEHAFASGMRVPASVMSVVEAAVNASQQARQAGSGEEPYDDTGEEIKRLTQAHEQLAKIVAPATPRALVILADHRQDGGFWGAMGPVPFIRHMMVVAAVSLLVFVVMVAVPVVDGDVIIRNFLKGGPPVLPRGEAALQPWEIFGVTLANEVFLVSAAALGASFAALFQANQYIAQRTYDPQYEISYWIKFVVGLMAGLILCLLVPLNLGAEGTTQDALEKPLLALLGGFSASAVYRILNRLVETVESLVRGSTKEIVSAAEEQARIQAEAQTEQMRLRMASSLLSIQQQMNSGTHPDEVKRRLDGMLNGMIPDRVDEVAPPAAPSLNGNGNGAYAAGGDGAGEAVFAPAGAEAFAPVNRIAPHLTEVVDDASAAPHLTEVVADDDDPAHDEPSAPAHLGAYHGEDESDGEDHEPLAGAAATAQSPFIPIVGVRPATPAAAQEDEEAVG